MHDDKRRNVRRPLSYPGNIDVGDGSPLRDCVLHDASEHGAQIAVAAPDELPDTFILALGFEGTARRRCRVVWRTEDRIGVEYLKDPTLNRLKVALHADPDIAEPAGEPHAAAVGK
jgi:hypothetical protein